jgi:hypothetical protein
MGQVVAVALLVLVVIGVYVLMARVGSRPRRTPKVPRDRSKDERWEFGLLWWWTLPL